VAELPAGGWCERAERLISDRMDGVLNAAGEARLEAHLHGCERCATHEQRLVQAHDLMVKSYLEARRSAPAAAAVAAPAELRVVEPPAEAGIVPSERGVSRRVWLVALLFAVLLALAAVVLAVLGATGVVSLP
jgi:anti-sigma factor RsiW